MSKVWAKCTPHGVAVDEWLDLWISSHKKAQQKGIEVDLAAIDFSIGNKCLCPDGWSEKKGIPIPEHLKKIKDANR